MARAGARSPRHSRKAPTSSTPQVVEVRAIAAGGDGVASLPDGKILFVPFAAPGDRLRVRVTEERERWARGELLEVVEASRQRVEPPCRHFGRCGGCTVQHLTSGAQIAAKRDIIRDALERIGGVEDLGRPEVMEAPAAFGYRSRVSFHLLRTPTRVVAGFQRHRQPGYIVSVGEECLLPTPLLRRVWGRLREAWGDDAERLPAGARLRLTLKALGGDPPRASLLVEREGGEPPDADGEAERSRLDELLAEVEELGEIRYESGAESTFAFEQVNHEAAALLRTRVLEWVGDPSGLRIVDGYCGGGEVGRRLAEAGAEVTGIELDPQAVRLARSRPHRRLSVLEGAVEHILEGVLPADLVLLNPPRSGVHENVTRVLSSSEVPRILYVSCDPATLARDVRRLGSTYRVGPVEGFDFFPQTAHVETLALLERSPDSIPTRK